METISVETMIRNVDDQAALEALETRLKAILPEEYQDCYEDVQPVSMGSAGLKYGSDGKVAWDDIWDTFCDLAMAGGPPHKGKLLEAGSEADITAEPVRYQQATDEICRGIRMVTDLAVMPSPITGWVRIACENSGMAGWLARAIVMENISARFEGASLDLPAGPNYRVEKEIKNVITAIAKTSHYWVDHMWLSQQRTIGELFEKMEVETPFIQPALNGDNFDGYTEELLLNKVAAAISEGTGLQRSQRRYTGWLGIDCPSVRTAVWMMRSLVVSNVLSRREETAFFVPINPASDPHGEVVTQAVIRIHGFAKAKEVL